VHACYVFVVVPRALGDHIIVFKLLLSINRYFLLFTGRLVLITGVKNIGYLFQRTRDILSSFKLKEERVKYCNATQHVQGNSF